MCFFPGVDLIVDFNEVFEVVQVCVCLSPLFAFVHLAGMRGTEFDGH